MERLQESNAEVERGGEKRQGEDLICEHIRMSDGARLGSVLMSARAARAIRLPGSLLQPLCAHSGWCRSFYLRLKNGRRMGGGPENGWMAKM